VVPPMAVTRPVLFSSFPSPVLDEFFCFRLPDVSNEDERGVLFLFRKTHGLVFL